MTQLGKRIIPIVQSSIYIYTITTVHHQPAKYLGKLYVSISPTLACICQWDFEALGQHRISPVHQLGTRWNNPGEFSYYSLPCGIEIRRLTRRCQKWSGASQCTRRTVGTMDHLRGCFLESEDILAQACSGHQGSLQKLWGGGAKFIVNSIGPMIGHSHSNHSVSLHTRNQVYHWNMVENQLHQTFKQNTNWTTAGNDWNMYTSANTNSKNTSKMMLGRAFFSFAYWDSASFSCVFFC